MGWTCENCNSESAFYVVERRSQAEPCAHWWCESHARAFLENAPLSYARPNGGDLITFQCEHVLHSVAIIAIPIDNRHCAVYLDCIEGQGTTVCIIGQLESRWIAEALMAPRDAWTPIWPSTYGAMENILGALESTLVSVVIDDFDVTSRRFYAKLMISAPRGPTVSSIRPSDAIALALTCDVPLYIAASVITKPYKGRDKNGTGVN